MRLLTYILVLFSTIELYAVGYSKDTIRITSSILNENRIILVFKPIDLLISDSISIIYLLDGEFSENRYHEILKDSSNRKIVGIGIINTNRNRDMLPVKQANKFLEFLTTELMPLFESKYPIKEKILFGHSFAGAFTLYSLINKPDIFDKYIVSSPAPIMNLIDPAIYTNLDSNLTKRIFLYFTYGSKDMQQVIKWGEKLNHNLSGLHLQNIKWNHDIFEGENHSSSDKIALINGLRY